VTKHLQTGDEGNISKGVKAVEEGEDRKLRSLMKRVTDQVR